MSSTKYICLRVFLVPIEDHLFLEPADHDQRFEWLRENFFTNQELITATGTTYGIRISGSEDKLVWGKLSKKSTALLHRITPDDIEEISESDWPYVAFMADMRKGIQKMVVQYWSAFTPRIDTLVHQLTEIASKQMFRHGYSVIFDTLNDPSSFWQIVDRSHAIYSVKFSLTSPNIFGASSNANESLKMLQQQFHINRLEFKLTNDNGDLNVDRKRLDDYREYADRGGGEWEITSLQDDKKKKTNSSQRARKPVIETENPENFESLKRAMKAFEDIE